MDETTVWLPLPVATQLIFAPSMVAALNASAAAATPAIHFMQLQ